jgi:type III restriction enzyme
LDGFSVQESTRAFTIDVEGEKVTLDFMESRQLHLNDIPTDATEQDFVNWLDKQVRQKDTHQGTLIKYLTALLGHLTRDRGLSLTALIRGKFQLVTAIAKEIERLRCLAVKREFQQALAGVRAASLDERQIPFVTSKFDPIKLASQSLDCPLMTQHRGLYCRN